MCNSKHIVLSGALLRILNQYNVYIYYIKVPSIKTTLFALIWVCRFSKIYNSLQMKQIGDSRVFFFVFFYRSSSALHRRSST